MAEISPNDLGSKIAEALGIKYTTRIVIDFRVDHVPMVYVDAWADEALNAVDLPEYLRGLKEKGLVEIKAE